MEKRPHVSGHDPSRGRQQRTDDDWILGRPTRSKGHLKRDRLMNRANTRRVWTSALVAALALMAMAATARANIIRYIPINDETDSEISAAKVYTHKLDFGTSAVATVNGVAFDQGLVSSLPANFNYQVISGSGSPNSHGGNGNHNVTGQVADLYQDMIYTGGNSPGAVTRATLSGLTPGDHYDVRIYTRSWGNGGGTRVSNITFDPDGAGPVSKTRQINEETSAADPPSLSLDQSYAISYRFQAGTPQLTIDFEQLGGNQSWHLYGVTNEQTRPFVPSLYSTGLDDNHDPLSPGTSDPHWTILSAPTGTTPTPALKTAPHSAWLDEDESSGWISINPSGTTNLPAGNYVYRTTFSLANFAPESALLELRMVVDDSVSDVLLNGVSTGISTSGHGSFSPWQTISSGFKGGINTLDFLAVNGGNNPHSFRAELFLTANYPEPATLTLLAFGGAGLVLRRRRKAN